VTARGASLWLAAAACAAAWPEPAPAPAACAAPEPGGRRGALLAVHCGPGAGASLEGAERLLFGLALDLNRADARALEALPGVGPARADAIVRERARAPFCGIADLDRVAGFGPATLARVAPLASAAAPACPRS
jgi:competence protein ComEA